jgi:hypothetical protein
MENKMNFFIELFFTKVIVYNKCYLRKIMTFYNYIIKVEGVILLHFFSWFFMVLDKKKQHSSKLSFCMKIFLNSQL